MSETPPQLPPVEPPRVGTDPFVTRLSMLHRAGGSATPLVTAIVAFLIGGLVVLATGHNPLQAYRGIFEGAGLNWLFHVPWDTGSFAAFNLQQTLLQTTTLIFTGLAVAFAFRCGLFNIGGQGQYAMGLIVGVWVGSLWGDSLPRPVHVVVGVVLAAVAGAVWAGIAGFLKATVGAHEVITTIMLNWIAYWFGSYLFGQGGPLQNTTAPSNPISGDVVKSARIPVFWGDSDLQGLHVGIFVAIAMLVVFWVILRRTTLGYEVRAVGFNAEAAAYGGISVKRSYLSAMAISGAFAGLGGGIDLLGYLYHFGTLDIQSSSVGFLGIAVALLGRNTSIGVGLSALLFGSLLYGTTRGLDPNVFKPELASNLTLIIQGLVVLFVGADVLILYVWNARRKLRRAGKPLPPLRSELRRLAGPARAVLGAPAALAAATPKLVTAVGRASVGAATGLARALPGLLPAALRPLARTFELRSCDVRRSAEPRSGAIAGIALALFGAWLVLPPVAIRSVAPALVCALVAAAVGVRAVRHGHGRPGWGAVAAALFAVGLGILATRSSLGHLQEVFSWGALIAAMLVFATPLVYAAIGGMFSERSGVVNIGLEGMMLMGAFFGILGADKTDSWVLGLVIAVVAGAAMALVHAYFAIHLRADQIVGGTAMNFLAVGITGYFFVQAYAGQDIPPGIPKIPDVNLHISGVYFLGPAIGSLNLMIWASFAVAIIAYIVMFRTPIGLRIRACGEHPRAADTLGINVYATRYAAVMLSGALAAAGGAYLSIGYVGSFTENMTGGRGFIALAALIFGNWRPFRAVTAALLFGFSTALAFRLPAYADSLPGIEVLVQALPYVLTLIAVAGVIGRSIPPAAVGRPYKKQ